MKSASIKISRLKVGQNIFKPDYYLNIGKKVISDLLEKDAPFNSLSNLSGDIYQGGIFKRVFVEKEEFAYDYITASNMVKSEPLETSKNISKKYTPWIERMRLKENQILVSCAGTVGNTALVNKSFAGSIGSQEIIRIENSNIPFGFIYAYLTSNTVNQYIQSMIYGAVVPRISPIEFGRLPVLLPDKNIQLEIHDLVIKAASLRSDASELFRQSILAIEVEISKMKYDKNKKNNIIKVSDIINNYQKRFDPPAYINDGIIQLGSLSFKSENIRSLKELNVKVTRPGIFKRVKVDKEFGLPYIKGSELSKVNPFSKCEYLSKTRTPFLEEQSLKENQILLTCAGTVGETKLISKEYEELKALGSQDIIRVEAKDSKIDTMYLYAYLNVPIVKSYIQSLKYGSVIERVEPFHIETIPVLIPDSDIIQSVSEKIENFKNYRYLAFKKDQEAIALVEKEIESWQK